MNSGIYDMKELINQINSGGANQKKEEGLYDGASLKPENNLSLIFGTGAGGADLSKYNSNVFTSKN